MRIRNWDHEDVAEWSRKIQSEKKKTKEYQGKDSISLLQKVQIRMKELEQALEDNTSMNITSPLIDTLRSLKEKQKNLVQIPFI